MEEGIIEKQRKDGRWVMNFIFLLLKYADKYLDTGDGSWTTRGFDWPPGTAQPINTPALTNEEFTPSGDVHKHKPPPTP